MFQRLDLFLKLLFDGYRHGEFLPSGNKSLSGGR
jgi:hypothetical protein